MASRRTFSLEFRRSILDEIEKARGSGEPGAITRILEREKLSSGTVANWRAAMKGGRKRQKEPPSKASYRVAFDKDGKREAVEVDSLESALGSYADLAASPGITNIKLWKELRVGLTIRAEVKEEN